MGPEKLMETANILYQINLPQNTKRNVVITTTRNNILRDTHNATFIMLCVALLLLVVVEEYITDVGKKHIKVDITNKTVICLYVSIVSEPHRITWYYTKKSFYFGQKYYLEI